MTNLEWLGVSHALRLHYGCTLKEAQILIYFLKRPGVPSTAWEVVDAAATAYDGWRCAVCNLRKLLRELGVDRPLYGRDRTYSLSQLQVDVILVHVLAAAEHRGACYLDYAAGHAPRPASSLRDLK